MPPQIGFIGSIGLWEAIFADVGVALLAVLNSARAGRGSEEALPRDASRRPTVL